jgi:SulP family sulfate permease
MPNGFSTSHLYRPKLLTTLSEGYGPEAFRADVAAALTVAIVALPLSMAIAVASGVSPGQGLYTAIVGGFLVSLLGGSRYQIGGPAGAFIVFVSATVAQYGPDGLVLAVLLSGVMLAMVGLVRLGSLIRHIPHAVTVGFTCSIAVIIFASQMKDIAGLRLDAAEPGSLMPKLAVLLRALPTLNPTALTLGLGCAAAIFLLNYAWPKWPAMLIAIIAASAIAWLLHLRPCLSRLSLPLRLPGCCICQWKPSPTVSDSWPMDCLLRGCRHSRWTFC